MKESGIKSFIQRSEEKRLKYIAEISQSSPDMYLVEGTVLVHSHRVSSINIASHDKHVTRTIACMYFKFAAEL